MTECPCHECARFRQRFPYLRGPDPMNPTTIAWGIYACMTARRLMYQGVARRHAAALLEAVAVHTMNRRGATP